MQQAPHQHSGERRVVVIVNPVHRRGDDALSRLLDLARAMDLPAPVVMETTPERPGGPQAREALAAGADVVVVVGGDGTVREVAAALAGTETPMGIVPTGTANLFARNTGLAQGSLRDQVVRALAGATRRVDVGRARLGLADGSTREETFLVVAGVGHDAETIAEVRPAAKNRLGWLAYFGPGLRRLAAAPRAIRVRLDDGPSEALAAWTVLVASCGRIPAGLQVVPGTAPDDGRLHVAVVAPDSPGDWLAVAVSGLVPARRARGISHRQAQTVSLTPAAPTAAHLDGDLVGDVSSLQLVVEPGALVLATAPAGDAPIDRTGHTAQSAASIVHELHRGPMARSVQEAVVDLLTSLHGAPFREVKYRLNSTGDVHDLEHLVFDDLDDDLRARLLAHIDAQARAGGAVRDVRVLCDIDDTLKASLHEQRYDRGTVYPGIRELLHALDEGTAQDPSRPGDLTFVTARPGGPGGLVEQYTRGDLDDLGLPPHTIMGGSLLSLRTRATIEARKVESMRRDHLLFPECRMVFLGDSGQADAEVGQRMRREHGDHVVVVYIHDVVGLSPQRRAELAADGVVVVDTWDEAARHARSLDLISAQACARVEEAVRSAVAPRPRRGPS